MKAVHQVFVITVLTAAALWSWACAEKGKSGTEGLDCGDHGSAHEDHCHCNEGYFFDGTTCVAPAEIIEVCAVLASDAGEADSAVEPEHGHEACVCPLEGECPCDGEISTYGGKDYCAPELHED